jgi:hypothetical protein
MNTHISVHILLGLPEKSLQTWWFKTVEFYSFTILEARSLKSRCFQGHAPSESSWDYLFRASLLVSGGCWQF